jgi:hypothetical protein
MFFWRSKTMRSRLCNPVYISDSVSTQGDTMTNTACCPLHPGLLRVAFDDMIGWVTHSVKFVVLGGHTGHNTVYSLNQAENYILISLDSTSSK